MNWILEKFSQKWENNVVDLWNRCCPNDPITLERFRKQALFDENYDPQLCWIAQSEGKVIGFVLATHRKFPYLERGLEPERGWINVLFIDPDFRCKGIGKSLYQTVENKLIQLGVNEITLGAYSPNYFFSGLDEKNYPEAMH